MSFLALPMELHLEVVSYCDNADLAHLIRTHSLLNRRLQHELHKRALSWRPEGASKGGTTLDYALTWKRKHLVDYLLRHNAVDIEEGARWNALDWAFEFAPSDVIKKLVDYASNAPAPLNKDQVTSVFGVYLDRVPHKLNKRPKAECEHGQWCECGWAVNEEELQVVQGLLQLGADPMGLSKDVGYYAEYHPRTDVPYTFRARNGDILRLLIEAGADIHWQPPRTRQVLDYNSVDGGTRLTTVLHTACFNSEFPPSVVLELLKHGADPNCQGPALPDAKLVLPLFETLKLGVHPKKSEYLLDYGVDTNVRDELGEYQDGLPEGNLPIHEAVELTEDYAGTWTRLISGTLDLEARSYQGMTTLQEAITSHSLHYARILIEGGANINVRDSKGKSLIHLPLYEPDDDGSLSPEYYLAERRELLTKYGLEP